MNKNLLFVRKVLVICLVIIMLIMNAAVAFADSQDEYDLGYDDVLEMNFSYYNENYLGLVDSYYDDFGWSSDLLQEEFDTDEEYLQLFYETHGLPSAYIKLSQFCDLVGSDYCPDYEQFEDNYASGDFEDTGEYLNAIYTDEVLFYDVLGEEHGLSEYISAYEADQIERYGTGDGSISERSGDAENWYYNTGTSMPGYASYDTFNLCAIVRKGDIIYETTGTVFAKIVGHTAIVEGTFWDSAEEEFYIRVIEATEYGVRRGVFDDNRFMQKGGKVLRVAGATQEQKDAAVEFCLSQLGKSYSLHTNPNKTKNAQSWYCSELVWAAYRYAGIQLLKEKTIITPKDIYSAGRTELQKCSTKRPVDEFLDVNMNWSYNAVVYLTDRGIMNGTSSTTFSPKLAFSREMLVTILYRLEGMPEVTTSYTFSDVRNRKAYYYNAIKWAYERGITNGMGDGTFGVNQPLTREQIVTFLYRYAVYKGYNTSYNNSALQKFNDKGTISSYSVIPMKWAVSKGIINGVGMNTIAPLAKGSRECAATIIYRYIEKIM